MTLGQAHFLTVVSYCLLAIMILTPSKDGFGLCL